MRRMACAAMVLGLVVVLGGSAFAESTVEVVKGTKEFEAYGAATNDGSLNLFGWTEGTRSRRYPYAAFVEAGRHARERINAEHTNGFMGTFDSGTDRLIFQQTRGNESDVFLYDVSQERRLGLPAINNGAWQWSPSVDTEGGQTWILYEESRLARPSSKWRLYLFNRSTEERTLLDQTTNRCRCMFPGNVSYPWVTWTRGIMGTAYRYNIETDATTPLALPTHRDEYLSAVTTDGTAFVVQAGDRCGSNPQIYRIDPDGTATLFYDVASKGEPIGLSVDERSARVDLYFDRIACRSDASDILRIVGADTAPARGGRSSVRSSPRAWLRSQADATLMDSHTRREPPVPAP